MRLHASMIANANFTNGICMHHGGEHITAAAHPARSRHEHVRRSMCSRLSALRRRCSSYGRGCNASRRACLHHATACGTHAADAQMHLFVHQRLQENLKASFDLPEEPECRAVGGIVVQ